MAVSSVADVKQHMGNVFNADKASGVDAVFQFDLSGTQAEKFWVHVRDGVYELGDGEHEEPSITVLADADDYIKIVNGDIQAMSAFMTGKLKVKGEMGLALKLQSIFPTG